jgi:hypothetical protein
MSHDALFYTVMTDQRSFVIASEDSEIVRKAIAGKYDTFRVTALKVDGEPDARVEIRTSSLRGLIRHEPSVAADVIPFPTSVRWTAARECGEETRTSPVLV